jgi:hypothetical protein
MIKLKDILLEASDVTDIFGYFDAYGGVHYTIVTPHTKLGKHNEVWSGKVAAHGKWRWSKNQPKKINTYNEPLTEDEIDKVWEIVSKHIY